MKKAEWKLSFFDLVSYGLWLNGINACTVTCFGDNNDTKKT